MINPFKIVWELIEFGIQALFVYVLVIIIFIGIVIIVLQKDPKKEWDEAIHKAKIEYIKECTRIDGCRIREDGTVEW